jgi:hypothetical protein
MALIWLGPGNTVQNLSRMWEELGAPHVVFPVVRQVAIVQTAVTLVIMIYGIIVGWRIWKGSPKGRALARQYLVVRAGVAVLLNALIIAWGYPSFGRAGGQVIGRGALGDAALELGICTLWWTYFTYSRRVRELYASEG